MSNSYWENDESSRIECTARELHIKYRLKLTEYKQQQQQKHEF